MKRLYISLLLSVTISAYSQTSTNQTPLPSGGTGGGFLSLSLSDCRRLALEHNEQVQTADNAVMQAELDRQVAFASYLPKLDGSLTGFYLKDNDFVDMTLQMRGAYMAGLNITQPIYAGGQITAANRLAAIGKEASEEQRRQIRMQVIADVDRAYYTLVSVQSKIQMLEAYSQQMQGLYDQVALSVRAQMATQNDLLRISTKQNEIGYQLQKARNGEELCRLALANIIGADVSTPISIASAETEQDASSPLYAQHSDSISHRYQPYLPDIDSLTRPHSLPPLSESIANRPELHLLEKQVEAKEQQVKMARASYLPTVGLSLGYSHYDNIKLRGTTLLDDGTPYSFTEKINGNSPMALLSVSIPVFHWGAELKKVKKAKLDAENARLQLQQSERGMRIEVRQAVQNLTDGQRMVETARVGQQQADENLRVMRLKYDAQLATMTDLLDAQSQWQQARSNLIEAQTQLKVYETEYLRVTGCLE